MTKTVQHGSAEYWKTVELRREVLRKPLGLDFTPEQLASEASDVHLAIFENEVPIGCLILTQATEKQMKMRQVAVAEASQGKGIGRQLVEYSEELASKAGFNQMALHARESAVPFYQRLGYVVQGDGFEEVGIPHFYMSKTLA